MLTHCVVHHGVVHHTVVHGGHPSHAHGCCGHRHPIHDDSCLLEMSTLKQKCKLCSEQITEYMFGQQENVCKTVQIKCKIYWRDINIK